MKLAFLERAVASSRLHALVTNTGASYWVAFWDSQYHERLDCSNGAKYRVEFAPLAVPVDFNGHGFWSVTLYDDTWFLVGSHNGIRSNNPANLPGVFHIYQGCTEGYCLSCPNGPFQLNFRGYKPLANLLPGGDYPLPKIIRE